MLQRHGPLRVGFAAALRASAAEGVPHEFAAVGCTVHCRTDRRVYDRLFTPQLIIAAILLDVPIVLSAFAGNRRLTSVLVIAGLIANVVAGYINGVQAGGVWDPVAIGNRAFAALSIILVGWLGLALHRGAEQQGIASAIASAVRRERDLREASDNIRSSLSEELVERAIAREAMWLVSATRVAFYRATTTGSATRSRCDARRKEVVEITEAPRPEIRSALARALEAREPSLLSRDDAMGRHVLDALGIDTAVVVPLVDGPARVGSVALVEPLGDGRRVAELARLCRGCRHCAGSIAPVR